MDNNTAVESLRERIISGESGVMAETENLGNKALDMLVELMGHTNGEVRASALGCISLLDDERVAEIQIRALGDQDDRVRIRALQWLRARELDRALLPRLVSQITNPDPEIRASLALLLGEFDDREAADPLYRQFDYETDPDTALCLKLALARLGNDDFKEEFALILRAEEPGERLEALEYLRYINDKKQAGRLLFLLDDKSDGYDIGDLDNPRRARICDAVVNLVSKWYDEPFGFEVDEFNVYTDDQIEETRKFLESLGE